MIKIPEHIQIGDYFVIKRDLTDDETGINDIDRYYDKILGIYGISDDRCSINAEYWSWNADWVQRFIPVDELDEYPEYFL